MKRTVFLLLLFVSAAAAAADWLKIPGAVDSLSEVFIDTSAIRQTGPMNTMRRVWELRQPALRDLPKGSASQVVSSQHQVEYDCKDRRFRTLAERSFSAPWGQGEMLVTVEHDIPSATWREIAKGGLNEAVFNRVCPNDD